MHVPTTNPSGDGSINEAHQVPPHEEFDPPLVLYTKLGRVGRVFLRHCHPWATSMDSAMYIPQFPIPLLLSPPVELFDESGRVFRLDLLETYRPGWGIRYWVDDNYQPEMYVPGIDYLGDLVRSQSECDFVAPESLQPASAIGDMDAGYPVAAQGQQQAPQRNSTHIDGRNSGGREKRRMTGYLESVQAAVLGTAISSSGVEHLGKLFLNSSSTHSIRKSVADD